jgi:hypothetical protein
MGKRERSLAVQIGEKDIRITAHAIRRFRQRVDNLPESSVPYHITRMLRYTTPVKRRTRDDQRIYLQHERCVFVMTHAGLIVTVLSKRDGGGQFVASVKDVRREKKATPARTSRRSRFQKLERERHQREPRQRNPLPRHYDHEDD